MINNINWPAIQLILSEVVCCVMKTNFLQHPFKIKHALYISVDLTTVST